jgi:hypothetical protein
VRPLNYLTKLKCFLAVFDIVNLTPLIIQISHKCSKSCYAW